MKSNEHFRLGDFILNENESVLFSTSIFDIYLFPNNKFPCKGFSLHTLVNVIFVPSEHNDIAMKSYLHKWYCTQSKYGTIYLSSNKPRISL